MMKKLLVAVMSFSLVAMAAATASAQATGGDPAASSAPEVSASGAGVLKKASFRSESGQVNNTSPTIFATALADTVVLTVPGCILTRFHSEVCLFGGTENNSSGTFRTLIGGAEGEGQIPGLGVFVSPDQNAAGRFETEGYNSWRCNLNPGTYSVVVQFKPFESGQTMCIRGRTLVTSWKK
jgi:hypothetical protein